MKPVSYLQTDARWANTDYSASEETTTIGKSGCGPSCMAMVIATLKDKDITPKETCAWALKNGYKAPNQGTYYSYFVPQGETYGIPVERTNSVNLYGVSSAITAETHQKVLNAVKSGNWAICCMGKGNWTSSGHYILWYGVEGKNALINDPNSTRGGRTKAALTLLQSQVKYYWVIEVPGHIEEAVKLADEIASVIFINDKPTLITLLNDSYNKSLWWVIKKLLSCHYDNKIPINGREDIYRRTIKAITVFDKAAYNDELLAAGRNSLYWVIKKLLDKLGVE